jgi:hypothetical protein
MQWGRTDTVGAYRYTDRRASSISTFATISTPPSAGTVGEQRGPGRPGRQRARYPLRFCSYDSIGSKRSGSGWGGVGRPSPRGTRWCGGRRGGRQPRTTRRAPRRWCSPGWRRGVSVQRQPGVSVHSRSGSDCALGRNQCRSVRDCAWRSLRLAERRIANGGLFEQHQKSLEQRSFQRAALVPNRSAIDLLENAGNRHGGASAPGDHEHDEGEAC